MGNSGDWGKTKGFVGNMVFLEPSVAAVAAASGAAVSAAAATTAVAIAGVEGSRSAFRVGLACVLELSLRRGPREELARVAAPAGIALAVGLLDRLDLVRLSSTLRTLGWLFGCLNADWRIDLCPPPAGVGSG